MLGTGGPEIRSLADLRPGLRLGQPIIAGRVTLLEAGQIVTPELIERLNRLDREGVIIRIGANIINQPVTTSPTQPSPPIVPQAEAERSFSELYRKKLRQVPNTYTEDEIDLIENLEQAFNAASLTTTLRQQVFTGLTRELMDIFASAPKLAQLPIEKISRLSEELIEELDTTRGNVVPIWDPEDPNDDNLYYAKHAVLTTAAFLYVAGGFPLLARNRSEVTNICLLLNIGFKSLDKTLLMKAGALTPQERRLLAQAFYSGYHKLMQSGVFREELVSEMFLVYERPDGWGIPFGFKGNRVPKLPSYYAVCSAYDALTTTRPYRRALHQKAAMDTIIQGVDRQFRRDVVQDFVYRLGVFPNGTLVRVDRDMYGIVSRQNPGEFARPVVTVVLKGGQRRFDDPIVVDLSKNGHQITKVIKLP